MKEIKGIICEGRIISILVFGGVGYIGSHTVKELIGKYNVGVLDKLSTGYPF